MATQSVVEIILRGVDENASGVLQGVLKDTLGLSAGTAAMGAAMLETTALTLGLSEAFRLVKDGIGGAADAAAKYQTQLQQAQANTTLTTEQTNAMSDAIQKMAVQSGASLSDLGAGYVHVTNIMGETADAMQILDAAQQSAVSTGGSVASYAQTLARVLHEFGMSGNEAAQAMDLLHTAAAAGDLTLEQFTANSGNALAMAANYGVQLDQVSAAYIALTKHGMDAADANTQISDGMLRITTVTPKVATELERVSKLTGVDLVGDFTSAGLAGKGYSGILDDLRAAYADMNLSSAEATKESMLLGDALRGGRGLAILAGNGYADYAATLKQLDDPVASAAKRQADYNAYLNTTAGQADITKQHLGEFAILVGGSLNESLFTLDKTINSNISDLQKWSEAIGGALDAGNRAVDGWMRDLPAGIGNAVEGLVGYKDTSAATAAAAAVDANKIADGWHQLGDAIAPTIKLAQDMGAASKDAAKDTADAAKTFYEGQKAQALTGAAIDHTTAIAGIEAEKNAALAAIATEKTNYDAAQVDAIQQRRNRLTNDLAVIQAADTAQKDSENNQKRLADQATAEYIQGVQRQEQTDTAAEAKRNQTAIDGFKTRTDAANDAYEQVKTLVAGELATEDAAEKHRVQVATDGEHDMVQAYTDAEHTRVQMAENTAAAAIEQIDRQKQHDVDAIDAEITARDNATRAQIESLDREKQAFDDTIAAEVKARQDQFNAETRVLDATSKAQIDALKDEGERLKVADDRRKELERVTGTKGEGAPAAALLSQYYGAIDSGNTAVRDALAAQISSIDKTLSDLMAEDQLKRQEAALTAQEQAITDQTAATKQGLQNQFDAFKDSEDARKKAEDERIGREKQQLTDALTLFRQTEDAKKKAVEETAAHQVQVLRDTLTQFKQQQADQLRDDTQRLALELRTYNENQAATLATFKTTEAGKITTAEAARQTTLAQIVIDTAAEKLRHTNTDALIKSTAQTEIDEANRVKTDRDNKLILKQQQEAADAILHRKTVTDAATADIQQMTEDTKKHDAEYAARTKTAEAHYTAVKKAADDAYAGVKTSIDNMAADSLTQIGSLSAAWGTATSSVEAYINAINTANNTHLTHAPGKGPQDGGTGGASGGTGPSGFVPLGDGHDTVRGIAAFSAAQSHLGSEDWFHDGNTYCEAFVEQMTGIGNMGGTAREAWDNWGNKQMPGQVYGGPNLLYFGNAGAGHVMIGNGSDGIGVLDPPWGVVEESISKFLHDNPGDSFLGSVPLYERGGIVPGQPGQPQLVIAHGGEEYLGINSERGGRGGPAIDYERLGQEVAKALAGMAVTVDGRVLGELNRSSQRAYNQTAPPNGVGGRF